MGEKYIMMGGNKTKMVQMPMSKYTLLGELDQITPEEVKKIGDGLGIDWDTVSLDELFKGTKEEYEEHSDVLDSVDKAVKVAYAHLKKMPDYYTKLAAMEAQEEDIPNTDANIRNADEVVKGGAGSGRYPKGSGGGKSEELSSTSFKETKSIVSDKMKRLSPADKESVKEAAKNIYYRQVKQNESYAHIGRKLGIKNPDIEVVSALLGVSDPRANDWRERAQ